MDGPEIAPTLDFVLTGNADSHGLTVAIHEPPASDSKHAIKLQDACDFLNVPHISPFEWIARERPKFRFDPMAQEDEDS